MKRSGDSHAEKTAHCGHCLPGGFPYDAAGRLRQLRLRFVFVRVRTAARRLGQHIFGKPSASPTEDAAFTPGTWLSDGGQYYFFDEGGATGRTAGLEDGTGVGFTYSIAGTEAVFSMGAADNTSSCTVSRNGDTVTLDWADGATEHLTYVSEQGSDTFQFYSNQELADLALRFYQENNSAQDNQNLTSAAQTNEDGSVSIQVYENLGDHNSTAAWYTVDRLTAAGTDGSGQEVALAG